MGDPERHVLAYEPFGDVGRERETLRRQGLHPLLVEHEGVRHARERREQHLQGVDRVEHRLLVLL